MGGRNEIINEYFKLLVLLNRANKKPNTKTEVTFLIRDLPEKQMQFVAALKSEKIFIELCVYGPFRKWEPSGILKLSALEEYCASILQDTNKTHELTRDQKENLCKKIEQNLRRLLILQDQV